MFAFFTIALGRSVMITFVSIISKRKERYNLEFKFSVDDFDSFSFTVGQQPRAFNHYIICTLV
jgi:hypothetical protein